MAVVSFEALKSKLYAPEQRINYARSGISQSAGTFQDSHLSSEWVTANSTPPAGSIPTTAAVPDRTTVGALGQSNPGGSEQRAFLERFGFTYNNVSAGGIYLLVDRLAHNGGLDGTVTTAQSNGAWPALTRYTTGAGVWAAIEVYTAIGTTQTTATMSYTNDQGTAGQTSQTIKAGGTGRNQPRRLLPMSLASGDKGVRAVASVTLAATTGTAGNFGVTLFKTLGAWSTINAAIPHLSSGRPFPGACNLPKIVNDACLQLIYVGSTNAGAFLCGGVVSLFED